MTLDTALAALRERALPRNRALDGPIEDALAALEGRSCGAIFFVAPPIEIAEPVTDYVWGLSRVLGGGCWRALADDGLLHVAISDTRIDGDLQGVPTLLAWHLKQAGWRWLAEEADDRDVGWRGLIFGKHARSLVPGSLPIGAGALLNLTPTGADGVAALAQAMGRGYWEVRP